MSRPLSVIAALSLIGLLVGACPGGGVNFGEPDAAGPNERGLTPDGLPTVYACNTVDILFVIDNSGTMREEQDNLAKSFPKLVERLASINPPIKSLHLGVISTDLGAGPYTIGGTAICKPQGDDGRLQSTPRGSGCAPSYPKYLEGPRADLAKDFACIAQLGTTGCGYEQQLEAALRALTAQPANDGFLRRTAPLAIVFVSDEDDCSARDESLFNPDDGSLGEMPTRCVRLQGQLHPISRYAEGFRGLKDNPQRVVVAAITGPPGMVQLDPTLSTGMRPICKSLAFGEATPGNRFSELVKQLGDRGVQASLCDGDLAAPLEVVGKALERVCLE